MPPVHFLAAGFLVGFFFAAVFLVGLLDVFLAMVFFGAGDFAGVFLFDLIRRASSTADWYVGCIRTPDR